jgi:hypothetical protein
VIAPNTWAYILRIQPFEGKRFASLAANTEWAVSLCLAERHQNGGFQPLQGGANRWTKVERSLDYLADNVP